MGLQGLNQVGKGGKRGVPGKWGLDSCPQGCVSPRLSSGPDLWPQARFHAWWPQGSPRGGLSSGGLPGEATVSHPPAEWLRMGWALRQCHTHRTSTLPGAWGWRRPCLCLLTTRLLLAFDGKFLRPLLPLCPELPAGSQMWLGWEPRGDGGREAISRCPSPLPTPYPPGGAGFGLPNTQWPLSGSVGNGPSLAQTSSRPRTQGELNTNTESRRLCGSDQVTQPLWV